MKKMITALLLLSTTALFAAEIMSHETLRASLAMSDKSLCNLDTGEARVVSRNPVIVSYTYTLTVGNKSESISFDQDRQNFIYTTDGVNFETLRNEKGSNLGSTPKDFMVKFNSSGKLVTAKIGNVVCK